MNASAESAGELVPAGPNLPLSLSDKLPAIVARAGSAAVFTADEFFCPPRMFDSSKVKVLLTT